MNFKNTPIVIIGSKGRMGNMFLTCFKIKGLNVCGIDRDLQTMQLNSKELKQVLTGAKVILLCVAIEAVAEVLDKIVPYLQKDMILADISSIKTQPLELMQKVHKGSVVGTHPLFGPNNLMQSEKLEEIHLKFMQEGLLSLGLTKEAANADLESFNLKLNQDKSASVAITPAKNAKEEDIVLIEELFKLIGCTVFRTEAFEHDQAMALIHSLNFLSSLTYFAYLAKTPHLDKYITPSFKRRMEGFKTSLFMNSELFTNAAKLNPAFQGCLQEYIAGLESINLDDIDRIREDVALARSFYQDIK